MRSRCGQRNEDRLEESATQHLDLAAIDERPQSRSMDSGSLGRHPLEQRPGVVQREAHRGMAFQGADHRLVRLVVDVFDHPAEVAHRLVVVNDESERDPLQAAVDACVRARDVDGRTSCWRTSPAAGR